MWQMNFFKALIYKDKEKEKIIGTKVRKLGSSGCPRTFKPAVGEPEIQPEFFHRMPKSFNIGCFKFAGSGNQANTLYAVKPPE